MGYWIIIAGGYLFGIATVVDVWSTQNWSVFIKSLYTITVLLTGGILGLVYVFFFKKIV